MRCHNLFVISLVVSLPATAEIYQWRDADGRVHYSDMRPVGENARPLRTRATQPAPSLPPRTEAPPVDGANESVAEDAKTAEPGQPAKPKTLAEKEVEFRQRRAEAAEARAKAEEARKRTAEQQRDCEQARNQLAALESGQRLARFNSGGEREVLDDAARAEETARMKRYIESSCK